MGWLIWCSWLQGFLCSRLYALARSFSVSGVTTLVSIWTYRFFLDWFSGYPHHVHFDINKFCTAVLLFQFMFIPRLFDTSTTFFFLFASLGGPYIHFYGALWVHSCGYIGHYASQPLDCSIYENTKSPKAIMALRSVPSNVLCEVVPGLPLSWSLRRPTRAHILLFLKCVTDRLPFSSQFRRSCETPGKASPST